MKQVKKNTFEADSLRDIESMDLSAARNTCVGIIEETSTKELRKQALIRDLKRAPTNKELSRIMWNVLLAGEGLSSATSNWMK